MCPGRTGKEVVRPEGLEPSTFWFVAEQGQNLSACSGVAYELFGQFLTPHWYLKCLSSLFEVMLPPMGRSAFPRYALCIKRRRSHGGHPANQRATSTRKDKGKPSPTSLRL